LQIKMQVLQGGLMVAEGEVQTTSNLKPGMVASLGVGAATGAIGMAAAIGGGTAVASEALLVSVEKDAKQAAKAVSERIIQGYKDRGWLSR
jgi:anti-sigma factor RsiW